MSTQVYAWKPRTNIAVDAQLAGEHLDRLRIAHDGAVDPEHVVEDAKSRESPLHAAFQWDDSEAAHSYRIAQALHLIRSLTISVTVERRNEPKVMRALVSVVKEEKRSYVPAAEALSDPELRAQILTRAWREITQWRERYKEYEELRALIEAIDAQQEVRSSAAA